MDAAIARELGAIRQSLDDMKEDVTEIKKQTTRTNGRVTALETVNQYAAGAAAQKRNIRSGLGSAALIVGTVFGGAVAALFTHFFGG